MKNERKFLALSLLSIVDRLGAKDRPFEVVYKDEVSGRRLYRPV